MPKPNAAALAVFERHRPLALRVARKYRRRFHGNLLPEEVSAAAFAGLWQAALSKHRLPPNEFEAFASIRVRGAILDEIRASDPLHRRGRKASATQFIFLSIDAIPDAEHSDLEKNQLLALFAVQPDAEERALAKQQLTLLMPAIALLRRRERDILTRLMTGRSPGEVARDLDISQARMSQIWARIIGKLQHSLGLVPARVVIARDWQALRKTVEK